MFSEAEQVSPEPMVYSIPDAAKVLGDVSQNHVRNLLAGRSLKKINIGRRVMVSAESLCAFIAAGGTSAEEKGHVDE